MKKGKFILPLPLCLARNPPAYNNRQHFVMSKYPQVMDYVMAHYDAEPDLLGAKVFKRKDYRNQ